MARTRPVLTTTFIVCFVGTLCRDTAFASQEQPSSDAPSRQSRETIAHPVDTHERSSSADDVTIASRLAPATLFHAFDPATFTAVQAFTAVGGAEWRTPLAATSASNTYAQGRWYRGRRNSGAQAAIILGATAAIAGSAVLVYANRPDCRSTPSLAGCGYGAKVIGGSVLSAGLVSLLVGSLTWWR